jgi:phytoene dehydrogenase-like protein
MSNLRDAEFDAVVVGAGPNGLAAAIYLAQRQLEVLLIEASESVGGGCRTDELTIPGFRHDVCSAAHPLAAISPFLSSLPLREHGLNFIHPPTPLAHPLDDGSVAALHRFVNETAQSLGQDGKAYERLMGPLVARSRDLADQLLGPMRPPRHPLLAARFARHGVRSGRGLAEALFEGAAARALFAGLAAHSILPLDALLSAGVGLFLGIAGHAVGWPVASGGSQAIADAMESYLLSLGGKVITGWPIESIEELPKSRSVLFDLTPRQLLSIAGHRLPRGYIRRLQGFRYGPGVFKLDFALDGLIPWRAPECVQAGTVHIGGTLAEIAYAESMVAKGQHAERPFVLVAQQSSFDPTRAPVDKHTAWAYCHVPAGSTVDMSDRIERQIERYAPGFKDRILARAKLNTADLERYNANYIGGGISGGAHDGLQLLARPVVSRVPYATPVPGVFLCSSSTPPGAGVHGMSGFHAGRAVYSYLSRRPNVSLPEGDEEGARRARSSGAE